MAKKIGKKPKTVLGTIGTLVLALLIYFLQGGKGGSGNTGDAVAKPPPPPSVVQEDTKPTAAEAPAPVKPTAAETPAPAKPAVAEAAKPPVKPKTQPAPAVKPVESSKPQVQASKHRARWHRSNLERHWEKHGEEFPECHSAEEYGQEAVELVDNPPAGTLRKTTAEGDQMFYHPPSNRFVVATVDGTIKTCFKPAQGIRYWNRQ